MPRGTPRKDKDLISTVKENMGRWYSYFDRNNTVYKDTTEFVLGDMWREEEIYGLQETNKTPLTFNKLAPNVNHLLGEQRLNTPNLQVISLSEGVSVKAVDLRLNIVKSIGFHSNSRVAYQEAYRTALIGGYGAVVVDHKYDSHMSFNQHIFVDGLKDPTKTFFDVNAKTISKGDGTFCGRYVRISKKEFARKYPRLKVPQTQITIHNSPVNPVYWSNDDSVLIVDYQERSTKPVKIFQMQDGSVLTEEDLKYGIENGVIEPGTIHDQRMTDQSLIKRYKIAGEYVLEESVFPGRELGIIFVDQNSYINKEGRQVIRPFVKDAMDSQRVVNYLGTQMAYLVKISRYDQWLVTSKHTEANPEVWRNPQSVQGGLEYTMDYDSNGAAVKPQQIAPAPLAPGLVGLAASFNADIQATMGLYDAQLGNDNEKISGEALKRRTRQGSKATFITFDEINRAITQVGNVIMSMMPSIYGKRKTVFMETSDSALKEVPINQEYDADSALSEGDYQIVLEAGASFEGQKEDVVQTLMHLLTANPQLWSIIGDLVTQNLPINHAKEITNRLRAALVSPAIVAAGKGEEPPPKQPAPPDPAAEMQKQLVQVKMGELQNKQAANQLKGEELKIQREQLQIEAEVAAVKAGAEIRKSENELHGHLVTGALKHSEAHLQHLSHHLRGS